MSAEVMKFKGVNYDTGTEYGGAPSRTNWDLAAVERDMSDIAAELNANSVCLYGSNPDRLREGAEAAAAAGLTVWIQPRSIEGDTATTARLVAEVAGDAENIRRENVEVYLNVGCELSTFAAGIMPGRDYEQRSARLSTHWPLFPLYYRRLNRMLAVLADTARSRFGGLLTYGGALWEQVDWRPFDIVGQNYYRLKYNERNYPARVAKFHRFGKPVVITEFGCCGYVGADVLGPSGHELIDYSVTPPRLRNRSDRDETVQARYLGELLEVYRTAEVAGTFVFEYVAEGHPHSQDERFDLDRAGYGIVLPHDRSPKAAFRTVAEAYRSP